ncbi:MAG: hypothetical protein Kapaf2KO_21680 [Candidatus Kapaibacteriales bacterium]
MAIHSYSQNPYTQPDEYFFYWDEVPIYVTENSQVLASEAVRRNIYLDVSFVPGNDQVGYACGYNSLILKTTDGGDSWFVNRPFVFNGEHLETIEFLDENVGYCSGPADVLYKTINAGLTWNIITPTELVQIVGFEPIDPQIWGFDFIDENRGVVCASIGCEVGVIYTTENGGASWVMFPFDVEDVKLADPLFLDRNRVLVIGSSTIYEFDFDDLHYSNFSLRQISRTNPFSNDWQEEIDVTGDVISVPVSLNCAGNADAPGAVRVSRDFGQTWIEEITQGPFYGTFNVSEDIIWAAGQAEGAIYTSDGGRTWRQSENCQLIDLFGDDIFFTDPLTGHLAGEGMYKLRVGRYLEEPQYFIDTIKCNLEPLSLKIDSLTEGTFRWSNGVNTQRNLIQEAGEYTLIHTRDVDPEFYEGNCTFTERFTFNVSFFPEPERSLSAIPETGLCVGDTAVVTYSNTDGEFVNWTDGNTDPIRLVTQNSRLIAVTKSVEECIYYDTIDVRFNPLPEVFMQADSIDVCINELAEIVATPGFSDYQWFLNGEPYPLADGNIAFGEETGYYSVLVTNGFGCQAFSEDSTFLNIRIDSNRVELASGPSFEWFGITPEDSLSCREYTFINNGTVPYTIDSIFFYRNVEFTIPPAELPFTLLVGESTSLTACYRPWAIHDSTDRDTLFVSDQCQPHILDVWGDPLIEGLTDTTECETEYVFRPLNGTDNRIFDRFYELELFPNPAATNITVRTVLLADSEIDESFRFIIFSAEGILIDYLDFEVLESEERNGYHYSTIRFDVSELANGTYYIYDIFGEESSLFTIIR